MKAFYNDVEKALEEAKNSKWFVLMGEFNAKIGMREANENDVMGLFGYGTRNERGEKLITFCRQHELFIANLLFKKQSQRKWTWLSPNGITKNEIDYFIVPRKLKMCVKNVEEINCLKDFSDHRLLRMKFGLSTAIKLYRNYHRKKIQVVDDPLKIKTFNMTCCRQLSSGETSDDVLKNYNHLEEAIRSSADIFTGTAKKDQIIMSETKDLLKRRQDLYEKSKSDPIFRSEFSKTRKESRKAIRRDVRNYEVKLVEDAIKKNQCLKVAKKGIQKGENWIQNLKDIKGVVHTDRNSILSISSQFYESLYSSNMNEDEREKMMPEMNSLEQVDEITLEELKSALNTLKNDKACGDSKISSDLL